MAFSLKPDWATFPKHYSTWLGVAAIILDSAYVFSDQLGSMLTPQTVILLNAVLLPAGMKILQLLKQDIPLEPAVKEAMRENITDAPTAKPTTVAVPPKPSGQDARSYIKSEIELAIEAKFKEIEDRIAKKKRKPTAPRTKALASEFAGASSGPLKESAP